MGAVDIGALVVRLVGDTKQLDAAGKKGEKTLAGLEKRNKALASRINKTALAVSAAFVAAATAIAVGMKNAIDEADKLAKAAETLGTKTEDLSRLSFAAQKIGVEFELLSKSLEVLNKGLAEMAGQGGTPASKALAALGISARDANGSIRSSTEVFKELAQRFSEIEDGAGKTALAVSIFGDEGIRLIPVLNKGADGLKEFADEADRLGLTLDSRTAAAARQFNEEMAKVSWNFNILTTRLAAEVLPVLQQLSDRFSDAEASSMAMDKAVELIIDGIKVLVTVVTEAITGLQNFATVVQGVFSAVSSAIQGEFTEAKETLIAASQEIVDRSREQMEFVKILWSGWGATVLSVADDYSKKAAPLIVDATDDISSSQEYLNFLIRDQNEKLAEGRALMAELRPFHEQHEAHIARLSELYKAGAIDAETFAKANQQAALNMASGYLGAASNISGALESLFKENKALAIANAIVNTAEGVTKALAASPPPLNFAQAAAVAAAGFAQVSAIRSTSKGGGSRAGTSPGAVGGSRGRGAASGGASGGPSQTLFVQGIDRNSLFSGDAVADLAQRLIDFQRDGGRVVLAET